MKPFNFRWQLPLLITGLILAGALPTQAAIHHRVSAAQVETFQVASNAHIAVGSNRSASLASVRVGDHVSIAYDSEKGTLVAHHISDGVPHNNSVSSTHHHAKTSSFAHIHGIVQSVNTKSGTLTIDYKGHHLL